MSDHPAPTEEQRRYIEELVGKAVAATHADLIARLNAIERRPHCSLVLLTVADGEWGGSRPADIARVCGSVLECFDAAISERPLPAIHVVSSSSWHPRWERTSDGGSLIQLSAREKRWDQFAYQFAHELLHALADAGAVAESNRACDWIEEALCEAASLFALRRLSEKWASAAPYEGWRPYAPNFAAYAEARRDDLTVPAETLFADWLTQYLERLETADYHETRAECSVVAWHLLPRLEERPETWRAVRYLNSWSGNPRYRDFFGAWRASAPDSLHDAIDGVELRLSGRVPPTLVAE